VDCFYYPIPGFGNIGKITEEVTSVKPDLDFTYPYDPKCPDIRVSIVESPSSTYQSITPAWIYGYQCGLTILKNYIPALLSTYTIRGIMMPVLKLLLLPLSPSSPVRNSWIVKYLLPYTANAIDETEIVKDDCRELRTLDYLVNLQIDLLMLFTFGIICPFMSLLILFTMVVSEFVDHMQIGSYLCDKAREIDKDFNVGAAGNRKNKGEEGIEMKEVTKERAKDVPYDLPTSSLPTSTAGTKALSANKEDAILVQFDLTSRIYLNNSRDLVLSVWKPNLLVILFFMQLILFDMIADIYFIEYGLVAVSICFVWIWFVFWDRMEKMSYCKAYLYSIYIKLLVYAKESVRKDDESDSSISNSSSKVSSQDRVELGDVKNPIQSQSSQ
jgi:hypothetical protein